MPRRRKKSAAARLRPFWFLVLLLFVLASFFAYFLVTWPGLRPHAIVVSGNRVVGKDAILQAASIDLQMNAWLQNTNAMTHRVEAIPYVDKASVHRRLPSTFVIDVTERVPFARLVTTGETVIVDRDLRVLQESSEWFNALPALVTKNLATPRPGVTLSQAQLTALRDDEEALTNAHLAAALLEHDKYGDLVVTLRNGIQVLFGDESDLAKKIPLVDPILVQVGREGRPIAAIDLRAPKTPVVEYKK